MIIKKLGTEYTDAVCAVDHECFSSPWSRDTIESLLSGDNGAVFGAFDECGELMGYAVLERILDEGSLTNIAVLSSCRKGGVGTKLMEKLMSEAKESELAFVTLEVRVSNIPAINLYRKFGFEDVGKRPSYYTKPVEDALLMTHFFYNDERKA